MDEKAMLYLNRVIHQVPPILFNFQEGRIQLVTYDFQITPPTKAVQFKRQKIEDETRTKKSPKEISKTTKSIKKKLS